MLGSAITFVQLWSAFFLERADFTNCPKGGVAHLCWLHSALSRCYEQITIWNHNDNLSNYHPACNYWKYCSVLWSWAFPNGHVENYWSVTGCHRFMRAAVLHRGYGTSSEDIYIKRRMYPSTHLEAEEFPLNWPESGCSWSGEPGALSLSIWSKGVFAHHECNKLFYIITNVENYCCNICVCWFQIGTFSMLCSQSRRRWTKQPVQVSIHLVGKQRVSQDLLFLVHCSVLISQRRHSIMHVTNWEIEGE